jgi:hypothetical protein
MDQQFIKLMSKGYVADNDLSDEDKDQLAAEAIEIMQVLKEDRYELYELLHSFPRAKQQAFLYRLYDSNYIEVDEDEDLTQEDIMGLTAGLGAGVVALYFVERYWFGAAAAVRELWSSISKRISDALKDKTFNKRMKAINAILNSNFDNCASRCGLEDNIKALKHDKKRLREALYYKAQSTIMTISPGMDLSREEREGAGCLLNCYLGYVTSVFAELVLAYDACLNKTGESRQFGLEKGLDVVTQFPVGTECGVMHQKLKDTYEDFEDALDSFFSKDPRLKREWINRLDQKIRDAKSGKHTKPDIMKAVLKFEPKHISL